MNIPSIFPALAGWLIASACTLAFGQMDTPSPPGPPAAQAVRPPAKPPLRPPAPPSSAPLHAATPAYPGDPQINIPLGKKPVPPATEASAPEPPRAASAPSAARDSMARCDRLSGKAAVAECRRRAAIEAKLQRPPSP
ncbi:hypothetical protein [Methylibium sp.]|uniref:hypothetical protein n=1 Tax=Methylibium sp. TaxID=2067992 RepID=UPI003D14B999